MKFARAFLRAFRLVIASFVYAAKDACLCLHIRLPCSSRSCGKVCSNSRQASSSADQSQALASHCPGCLESRGDTAALLGSCLEPSRVVFFPRCPPLLFDNPRARGAAYASVPGRCRMVCPKFTRALLLASWLAAQVKGMFNNSLQCYCMQSRVLGCARKYGCPAVGVAVWCVANHEILPLDSSP